MAHGGVEVGEARRGEQVDKVAKADVGVRVGTLAGHASVGGAPEVGKRLSPGTLSLSDLVVLFEVVVGIKLLLVVKLAVVAVVVVEVGELVAARVLGCDMHTEGAW